MVNENPQFVPGYIRLAEAHLLGKEPNLALDSLRNAEKAAPGSREVQIAFARYYITQKDSRSAEEVLAKLLAKNKGDLEARALLGEQLMAAGDLRRAGAEFDEIKRTAPNLPLGYAKAGELFVKQGKLERAVGEFERAVKLNPASWRLTNDLAFLLGETAKSGGDIDRALSLAEKVRTTRPEDPIVLDTVGWLIYRKGDAAKAADILGKAQAKAPEGAVVNYHLGMALLKAGRPQEAKQRLKSALDRKDPFVGREEAARVLAKI